MAKPRRSKTLEKVARSIKDSDEFVNHVFGIAAAYRSQHSLEAGSAGRAVRQALKSFNKHATALEFWLRTAQKSSSVEHEALGALSSALHGSSSSARAQATATQLWLGRINAVSERALQNVKRTSQPLAPRRAAEALRATFEHHALKIGYGIKGNQVSHAIRLFCAIAKDSGDVEMTPERARQWLKPASAPKDH